MRVLYLSQYFPPEVGATQTRAYEMARNLVRLGHQVTMLAEIPNHPSGVIPPEYRGRLVERTNLEGIDVIRVWVKTSPTKTGFTRMAFYLSYMVNAVVAGLLLLRGRYHVVYATSPPLFVACAGWVLSRMRRIPFVFEVRDLWPSVAVSLGELSNPRAIKMAESLERFLYHQAAAVVAVTQGFCEYIQDRGVPPERIAWIPNGTVPELFDPARGDEGLRQRLGLTGRFVVTFAGLHGLAQGLPAVLEAARHLLAYPRVVFLFIGEGPVKGELVAIKEREKLSNVMFLPEVSPDAIVPYLNMSDLLLVPLKRDRIFDSFVPSKLFDYMACARPILLSVPGEAREILEKAAAGVFVPPEDWRTLAETVLDFSQNPAKSEAFGHSGREYVIHHFSRKAGADKLASLLHELVNVL